MKSLYRLGLIGLFAATPASVLAQQASDYQAGVAARQAGHPEEAERLLGAWLAAHPGDVDAKVQLAYTELALGHLDAAETGFREVLAAAPDYSDARDGLALVSARRKTAPAATRPELIVEGGLSDLNGAADWYQADARLVVPVSPATTVDAGGAFYRRFGVDDVELSGTITQHVGQDLWLRLSGSGTPNADFRPRWGIGGGFDWRVRGGPSASVLTFDVRHEEFPAQNVTTLSPGVVQYLDGGHAWITARAFGVVPAGRKMQLGWLLRGDIEPTERYRLFAGIADGPDTDLGVVTQVTSVFGGFEVPLTTRVGLTASLSHEWRDLGFDRTELTVGLKAGL